MTTQANRAITIRLDKYKLHATLMALPVLVIVMFAIVDTFATNVAFDAHPGVAPSLVSTPASAAPSYPATGSELNVSLFSLQLPPPSLDALPYDVREPLSNGDSVPVKKRWLWVPPGQQIVVSEGVDGRLNIDVPEGALWWKEFYVETDRGSFLIERRIIARVAASRANPNGWAYYSAHYQSPDMGPEAVILDSGSTQASQFVLQPDEWIPTQNEALHQEIRFEDTRGVQYGYVFPGQTQCAACHNGAAGAYPNADDDPIMVFGLHPNNLTAESFVALVERGWITNGEMLLSQPVVAHTEAVMPIDALTDDLVAVIRNNCASCHNASPHAAANFTRFIVDPNYAYGTDELRQLLSVEGAMMPNAKPLVTPGRLDESEIWLRINGLEDRRQMPPVEGGLPDGDPDIIALFERWIIQSGQ